MTITEFFNENKNVAIAFSGGVDSAYLLYLATKHCDSVTAYYVKSQFQPQFELNDAIRLASKLKANLKIIEIDVLKNKDVEKNDEIRCYFCKTAIMSTIIENAKADGYSILLDGTNASDMASDRAGMKALGELNVISPLRICGLTKDEIRVQSKEANLFTWDKPAYACLATRIKPNEAITAQALSKVEKAEEFLMSLGFSNHRVRVSQNNATIIADKSQVSKLFEQKNIIENEFKNMFNSITFDNIGR